MWYETILRLSVALLLGVAIGTERQLHHRLAGLRTNALVAVGSCSFVLFAVLHGNNSDIVRLAGQIVTGIGFLGAGVIMRDGVNVRGLNTAATIWCSAGVGAFAGAGLYIDAICVAAFIMATNIILRPFVIFINRPNGITHYVINVTCQEIDTPVVRALLADGARDNLSIASLDSVNVQNTGYVEVVTALTALPRDDKRIESLVGSMSAKPGVIAARWHVVNE